MRRERGEGVGGERERGSEGRGKDIEYIILLLSRLSPSLPLHMRTKKRIGRAWVRGQTQSIIGIRNRIASANLENFFTMLYISCTVQKISKDNVH